MSFFPKRTLITTVFLLVIPIFSSMGAETCSRVAIINYQEVLVDTNTTQKGEGLRYHLEKDRKAVHYLNEYQKGTKINWQNAALGTAGTSMILAGFLTDVSDETKKTLFIGGASLILINFMVARTLELTNEVNLLKAVEEYNKRNIPRIYLKSSENDSRNPGSIDSVVVEKMWSF